MPSSATALREALEESLRRVVQAPGQIVTVEDKNYPELAALRISLDNANTGDRPPGRPLPPIGAVEAGLRIDDFSISGRPVLVQKAQVNLACHARDVQLGQGRDREGNILLLLQDAAEGTLEVELTLADLEALVLAGAKAEAAKQGVTVENVRIELRSSSDRALAVTVHVRAKKLFLTAVVRIDGQVAIDDQLSARVSGLRCEGEGTLGTLACGVIAPQLARFDGHEVSLLAFPLGEVQLRDVRITTGRTVRVTAAFGHSA